MAAAVEEPLQGCGGPVRTSEEARVEGSVGDVGDAEFAAHVHRVVEAVGGDRQSLAYEADDFGGDLGQADVPDPALVLESLQDGELVVE